MEVKVNVNMCTKKWRGPERFRRLGLYEDLTRGNCPTIRRVKILITYARRSQPNLELGPNNNGTRHVSVFAQCLL